MNNSTLRLTVLAGLVTAIAGHASPGLASHWVPPEPYLVYTNIIGWSEDNRFLVYEQGPEDESGLQYENSKTRWHIVSVRNGKESLLTKPEFNAWTKSNRLPEIAETCRMSPGDRIESLIIATQGNWNTVQVGDYSSTWKIEKWNGKPIRGVLEKNYYLLDTSERVNKRIDSHTFIPPKDAVEVRISPIWSNDGRRIAWFMRGLLVHLLDKKGGFKLENFNQVFIDRTWGPRIQIASKGLAPETIDKITTAIEQAGYAPTSEKAEPRQRAKSVVYAKKAFQEDAKKIAAGHPGGGHCRGAQAKGAFRHRRGPRPVREHQVTKMSTFPFLDPMEPKLLFDEKPIAESEQDEQDLDYASHPDGLYVRPHGLTESELGTIRRWSERQRRWFWGSHSRRAVSTELRPTTRLGCRAIYNVVLRKKGQS